MGKEKNTIRVILLSINKVILFNISKLIRKRQDLYVFLLFSIIKVILYSTNKVILSNTTKVILFGRIYKGIVVSPGFFLCFYPSPYSIYLNHSNSMCLK